MLENKYSRWYHGIVESAKQRPVVGYVERHHILPKSLGGSDDSENIVKLTAREHFVCHALLIRMTEGQVRHKMINALMKMKATNGFHEERYVNAKLFEAARQEFSDKLRDPVFDAARRLKISAAHKLLPKKTLTTEWKQRIGEAGKGRLHTESYKAHMSSCKSEFWAKRKAAGEVYPTRTCHCGVSGRGPNMSRYHFDNCKGAK